MIKHSFLSILLSLLAFNLSMAEDEPKFKVTPSGRVLIDGALFASPEKYLFKDGMAIPEARLGVKMYYGKWSSWIDVGFAYGKIGLRNMWIQYDFDSKNSLRVGNFLQPFGLQSQTTANVKPTFEQPIASALFNPGLQLGLMYEFHNSQFYSATAFHVESSALTNIMNYPEFNQQGYSLLERALWRNKKSSEPDNPILQAGISFGFSSPERHLIDDYDVHDAFTNSANFPTRVNNVTSISAVVDNARYRFKLTPELLLAYKKLALESQFFYQTIGRKNGYSNVDANSFYVTLRGVLIGGAYSYDSFYAELVNPKKNSLELVADFNTSNFQEQHANSFNVTLNYYFNPYITARLNYTFTKAWDNSYIPDSKSITQNVFQLRLMVLF